MQMCLLFHTLPQGTANPVIKMRIGKIQDGLIPVAQKMVQRFGQSNSDNLFLWKFRDERFCLTENLVFQLLLGHLCWHLRFQPLQDHAIELRNDISDAGGRKADANGAEAILIDIQQYTLAPVAGGKMPRLYQQPFLQQFFGQL